MFLEVFQRFGAVFNLGKLIEEKKDLFLPYPFAVF